MTQAQALAVLKTGKNVFLTGEPGSGKTHTVKAYIHYLRTHRMEPAITASTGIAATHIHGMTIHSWSGIGVREQLSQEDLVRISHNRKVEQRVLRATVLIIDEVSMLDGRTLDMVETVCRRVRASSKPFGGLQVVLVGDFFQLPPVASNGRTVQFAYASQAWQAAAPVVCYLSEQHRQEDEVFLELLTSIRGDRFSQAHAAHLSARIGTPEAADRRLPRLYSHNADVDRINAEELRRLPGEPKAFVMSKRGSAPVVESLVRGCLSPEKLELKVGAVVMFTKNSPTGRFVNGTLGKVAGFAADTAWPIVQTQQRKILAEPMEWTLEDQGRVRARIVQLPLRLAWAITIHKSQGMSMDAAVMDLSDVFEFGQGYVALSRVRTLTGLHLLGINERALQVHPEIVQQDQQFRSASEEVSRKLAALPADKLEHLHRSFISACGGSVADESQHSDDRADRYALTGQLVQQKQSIAQMAEARGRVPGTIFAHIEKLLARGDLVSSDVEYLRPNTKEFSEAFAKIQAAFSTLGRDQLKPIYEHFGGCYDYELLRLARLFGKFSDDPRT